MIDLHLKRIATDGVNPTMGVMLLLDRPFCVTLERPWKGNKRSMSCIPKGMYLCKRCRHSEDYKFKDSPKFGDTFQVTDVEERQYILFHKGNVEQDTHGCIILGESYGLLHGDEAVLSSGSAFNEFMDILKDDDEFMLTITNH